MLIINELEKTPKARTQWGSKLIRLEMALTNRYIERKKDTDAKSVINISIN